MKRSWNSSLWIGFVLVLAALFSLQFFVQFPMTRDFPWVNLLLFAAGGFFLLRGLVRAFGRPQQYRGKIFGTILTLLSLSGFALFAYGIFYVARQVPPSTGAPHVGQKAPDFSLPDKDSKTVALADLIPAKGRGALLVFYRGHW